MAVEAEASRRLPRSRHHDLAVQKSSKWMKTEYKRTAQVTSHPEKQYVDEDGVYEDRIAQHAAEVARHAAAAANANAEAANATVHAA